MRDVRDEVSGVCEDACFGGDREEVVGVCKRAMRRVCERKYKSGASVRVVCGYVSKDAKQRQEVEVEVKGEGC